MVYQPLLFTVFLRIVLVDQPAELTFLVSSCVQNKIALSIGAIAKLRIETYIIILFQSHSYNCPYLLLLTPLYKSSES